jgi:predicted dehydrogenase
VTQDRDSGAISRRSLMVGLGGTAAAAFAQPVWAQRRKLAASDKVNVAMIGAGGQGASNGTKLTSQNIVATADVDYDHVKAALTDSKTGQIQSSRQALKEAYDKATRYSDYRRMFDAQKDIDAVIIATPDHHHAVAARMAMERGIHVYVQKPLTYSIEEGR